MAGNVWPDVARHGIMAWCGKTWRDMTWQCAVCGGRLLSNCLDHQGSGVQLAIQVAWKGGQCDGGAAVDHYRAGMQS